MIRAISAATTIIAVSCNFLWQRLCLRSRRNAKSKGKPKDQSGSESSGAKYESHDDFP